MLPANADFKEISPGMYEQVNTPKKVAISSAVLKLYLDNLQTKKRKPQKISKRRFFLNGFFNRDVKQKSDYENFLRYLRSHAK